MVKENKNNNDDKKRYQINIALSDYEYSLIKTIAINERRTVADVARLILIDNAQLLLQAQSNFKKALFIPGRLPGDN